MQYRRLYTSGATYFFTLVSYKRQRLFINFSNIKLLNQSIKTIQNKHPFVIDAIVILPEHLHCIITLPDDDHDFSLRWRLIKAEFTRKHDKTRLPFQIINLSRHRKKEKYIWQRRFWEHQIRDEKDFNMHMDYIHYNPVKHGLVLSPKDWQFSSFRNCVTKGFYDLAWGSAISDTYFDKIVNAE